MNLGKIGSRLEVEKPVQNLGYLENKFKTFEKKEINK